MEQIYTFPRERFEAIIARYEIERTVIHADETQSVLIDLSDSHTRLKEFPREEIAAEEFSKILVKCTCFELSLYHQEFTGQLGTDYTSDAALKLLREYCDRDFRIDRLYPWLISLMPFHGFTEDEVKQGIERLEGELIGNRVNRRPPRLLKHEQTLSKQYRVPLLRIAYPAMMTDFQQADLPRYASYAVIDFIYSRYIPIIDPRPIRDRMFDPKHRNIKDVFDNEIATIFGEFRREIRLLNQNFGDRGERLNNILLHLESCVPENVADIINRSDSKIFVWFKKLVNEYGDYVFSEIAARNPLD